MTTAMKHHLDGATLMSYAAGSLPEPLAAAAAAHFAMCHRCRAELFDMELLGAVLVNGMPAAMDFAREQILPPGRTAAPRGTALPATDVALISGRLPYPIAHRYGLQHDRIPWKLLAPGVWHHRLPLSPGVEGDLRLLRISAGMRMPVHGHGGAELTVVIEGAYADDTGEYRRGDVQDVDEDTEHEPVADQEHGCICLIASERPARFKTLVGRIMQPWTGL